MKRKLFTWLAAITLAVATQAQVKVGDNPTTVDPNAALEIESTSKGVLLPRLTTVQRNAMTNVVPGTIIYNTDVKCTEVFIGVGTPQADAQGWKNQCRANVNAVFQSATLACGGALAGDYVATVAMIGENGTNPNSKIVTVTVTTAGDYSVSTDEVNGISFSAEGTIQSVGAGTQLKMYASGTPEEPGTFTYTVTLSGQSCTFNVTFLDPPATFLNDEVNCVTATPATGTYTAGNTTVPTVHTKIVQVTPTSIGYYSFTTGAVNGVTFSASGTFTAGDVNVLKTVTLTASGTPAAAGTFNYTVDGTGISTTCSFDVTVSAGLDYLIGYPTAGQTLASGQLKDINFTAKTNKGISVSGSNFTLRAGKTYILQAVVTGNYSATGNAYRDFDWVNSSNVKLANATSGISLSSDFNDTYVGQPMAVAIVTVGGSNMVVKLRCTVSSGAGGNFSVDSRSHVYIREIASTEHYLLAETAAQTITGAATNVNLTQKVANGVSVSGNTITLKAGKTYRLTGAISGSVTSSLNGADFAFVDASNNLLNASNYGLSYVQIFNTVGISSLATAMVTVGASDIQVRFRCVQYNGSGNLVVDAGTQKRSFVAVEEIPTGKDFIYTEPTSNQTAGVGTNITMQAAPLNSGASVSGNTFTLKAGKTYFLQAGLGGSFSVSTGGLNFLWVDNNNSSVPFSTSGLAISSGYSSFGPSSLTNSIVKTGTSDVTVRLRCVSGNGATLSIDPNAGSLRSFVNIYQIE